MQFRWMAPLRVAFWSLSGAMWDEQASTAHLAGELIDQLTVAGVRPGDRVLDLGCGAGVHSVALASAGFDVLGVDAAPGMLARARRKITPDLAHHLRFHTHDADRPLPFADQAYQAVIAVSVLQTLSRPALTCREVHRILVPGGVFVVIHFGRQPHHDQPLRRAIEWRIAHLVRKTWRNRILAMIKVVGERVGAVSLWDGPALQSVITGGDLVIEALSDGPTCCRVLARRSAVASGAR